MSSKYDDPLDHDGHLYHATSEENVESIKVSGMREKSYWATLDIALYYAGVVEDESLKPILLKAPISIFKESLLRPDRPGIDEPLTCTLGKSEREVMKEWSKAKGGWRDSLEIVGSVFYEGAIAFSEITIE